VFGVAAGFVSMAAMGVVLQLAIFRHMEGQDMRQTMVTIGLSSVLAAIMLWMWSGNTYKFAAP
jgi:branched-chain amino acid transport system permease protein